jgi:hypothetical protein
MQPTRQASREAPGEHLQAKELGALIVETPHPVFRGRTVRDVRQAGEDTSSLLMLMNESLPGGEKVNGLRYDADAGKVRPTLGKNALEARTVRFIQVGGRRWDKRLVDAVGFPFRTDTDAAVPIWGDLYIGGAPLDGAARKRLGLKPVSEAPGRESEAAAFTQRYKRKVYMPGEFSFVVARSHEADGRAEDGLTLYPRFRLVEDPAALESHVRRFGGPEAATTIGALKAEAAERVRRRHARSNTHQSQADYAAENLAHEYILCLGEHLQSAYGTAQVWRGCALAFGGTGSEYYGSLRLKNPDGSLTVGADEAVTITTKESAQLADKAAFVGRKALLDAGAKGIFLDMPHQPGFSDVPIGGAGVECVGRQQRDRRLLEEGAVFSEFTLDVMPLVMKSDVDAACAPLRMCDQRHELADERPELRGLYVPVTIVLDDTRRLHEVSASRTAYMEYVTSRFLGEKEAAKAKELIRKLGKRADGSAQAEDAAGALVRYTGGETGPGAGGLGGGEALLLSLMYGKARDEHLELLSRNLGRNLRAVMRCDLNAKMNAQVVQNLSAEGGITDTGDLKEETPLAEVRAAVATAPEDLRGYVLANELLNALPGANPKQENVYRLWVGALFETVGRVGVEPIEYMSGKAFNTFMLNFLGGSEAGSGYGDMVEGIRRDFVLRPPSSVPELVERFSGRIGRLFREYGEQERSRSMMEVDRMLHSSPFAMKSSAVNSAKSTTPAGIECFRASDGALMVTPGQFVHAVEGRLQELEGTLNYSYHYGDDEYGPAMKAHQEGLKGLLDEVMVPLAGEKGQVELVGWGENYAYRHIGGNLYSSIAWDSREPPLEGERIHLLSEPKEERRVFRLTDGMIDIMYGDDEAGKGLGHDANEVRLVRTILADLRRTVASGDWAAPGSEAQEKVWYALDKAKAVLGLFETIPHPDYHAGRTDYMFSRIGRPARPPTQEPGRNGRMRFDWTDETD